MSIEFHLSDYPDDIRYGIPAGTSDYTYLQGQISKMEKLVQTLNDFQTKTHPLDTNHQDAVAALQKSIQSLYSGDFPFHGAAADNLSKLVQDYMKAEHSFTGTQGETSPQLASVNTYSHNAAISINQELQSLYNEADQYALTLDRDRSIPGWLQVIDRVINFNFPSSAVLDADCVLPPSTIYRLGNMEGDETSWGNQMTTLGDQPPPALPPQPTDPKPFIVPPSDAQYVFTNEQLQQMRKLAEELYNEFGGDVSLEEIEQMIMDHPQWSREKLRQELLRKLLREGKGYVGQLVGKTVSLGNGRTKTLTEADIEAMIKAGYTNTLFAVILGLLPPSDATTPQGRKLSWHALVDSIPRHGITLQEIDAVIDNPSRTSTQTDGGEAYIKSTKQGYSLVIVSSTGEVVTAMKGLNSSELKRLGQRYGFNPNP